MKDTYLCASLSDHKLKLMAKSAAMFTVITDVNNPALENMNNLVPVLCSVGP